MPDKAAIKADLLTALALCFLRFALLNVVITVWPWTPLQVRVKVNVDVFLEL